MTYRIRDWAKHYENNRTRELKRMDWVPMPNKMDGLGYNTLVSHANGAAHLGVWLAVVEIASRCDVRGTLVRGGVVLTPQMLSGISRLPVEIIQETIERLCSPEIGWLEVVAESIECEIPQDDAESSAESRRTMRDGDYARASERNGTEGNGTESPPTPQRGAAGVVPIAPFAPPLAEREAWGAFREAWDGVGDTVPSEPDWAEAYHQAWRKLDHAQRRAAIDWCCQLAEAGADDPARKAMPVNFLRKQMWTRQTRARDAPKTGPAKFDAIEYLRSPSSAKGAP